MEKGKIKETTKEIVDHLQSDEVRLKFVSFCCVIIVIILVIISGELFYLYKSLNCLIDLVEDGEYDRVSEVFYNEKKPEDLLPILEVTSTTEEATKNDLDNSVTVDISSDNTTEKITESTSSISNEKTYVINKNSKKIHREDCSFANRISEENKQIVQLSNDELNEYKNNGYTLCSSCGG